MISDLDRRFIEAKTKGRRPARPVRTKETEPAVEAGIKS